MNILRDRLPWHIFMHHMGFTIVFMLMNSDHIAATCTVMLYVVLLSALVVQTQLPYAGTSVPLFQTVYDCSKRRMCHSQGHQSSAAAAPGSEPARAF